MKLKIKNPLDPVINFVDDKLKKFDPIWMAENGVGGQRTRYYDQTGIAKYREWRGVKDTMQAYVCWLKNLGMTPEAAAGSIDTLMNLFPQLEAKLQELLGTVIPINETTLKAVFFCVPHRLHLAIGGGALMLLGNVLSLRARR